MVAARTHRASIPRRAPRRLDPRQEPYELKVHVRICAGGARQRASLPRYPIGENGGPNVFAFVQNNPIGWHDALGLTFDRYTCPTAPAEPTRDPGWSQVVHAGRAGKEQTQGDGRRRNRENAGEGAPVQ